MAFFSQEFQYALGWTVIHSLWQATAIALLSGVVMIVLRKKTAQTRYIVHNVALFSVLVAAAITFGLYSKKAEMPTLNVANMVQPTPSVSADPTTKVSVDIPDAFKLTVETGQPEIENPKSASPLAPLSIEGMKAYFDAHIYFVVLVWLMGVGLFLLKLLGGISYVYYLRSQHNFPVDEYWADMMNGLSKKVNIKKNIDLVESALVRSPVVVGLLKPMILFPIGAINRLNPQEVEAILAHEIAHVMRHDYVFNIIQSVIEALFYFNPAVWWISANIRAERENCCDDVAIQLCGNSMTYAKSLVLVQEMQYYSAAFAMGFAGQRKNQLLLRVQRVLNQSNNKSNVMEKLIATCLIILGFIFLSFGSPKSFLPSLLGSTTTTETTSASSTTTTTDEIDLDDTPLSKDGFWNATIKGDEVTVAFSSKSANNNLNTTHIFKKSEFSAMPTTESDFNITREAGTMALKGKFDGEDGYGKFTFTPNADFQNYLTSQGISDVKETTMMHLFMSNINRDYIAFLKQNGYDNISKSQLQNLAIHGIDKAYLTDLQTSGYKPSGLEEVIQFRIHGVNGAFIKKMKAATNKELTSEDLVNGKIHGLDKMDVEKFKTTGTDPTGEDLQSYAIHGVDADYINLLTGLFGKLSPDKFVEAKIHGIDANFVKSYQSLGFKNMNIDKAIEFKIHGVDANFVKTLNEMGYKDFSSSKVVELKIHGVTADYIKGFEAIGYKNIPINKLIEFKIHGVTPSFVQSFDKIGYKNIETNKLTEMKIHGVTGDFIKGFMDIGFKKIDLDDAVTMKIHGVTPQYIQDMRAKGYKDLDIDEYINMKIQGNGN